MQKDSDLRTVSTFTLQRCPALLLPNHPSLKYSLIRQSKRTPLSPDTSRRLRIATCTRGIRTKKNEMNRPHEAEPFFENLTVLQLMNILHFIKPSVHNDADKSPSLATILNDTNQIQIFTHSSCRIILKLSSRLHIGIPQIQGYS